MHTDPRPPLTYRAQLINGTYVSTQARSIGEAARRLAGRHPLLRANGAVVLRAWAYRAAMRDTRHPRQDVTPWLRQELQAVPRPLPRTPPNAPPAITAGRAQHTANAHPTQPLVHSPGPWHRWKSPDGRWYVRSADKSIVAEILPWDVSGCRKEDHDNAGLIVESPEMLKVVEAIANVTGATDLGPVQGLSQEILMRLKTAKQAGRTQHTANAHPMQQLQLARRKATREENKAIARGRQVANQRGQIRNLKAKLRRRTNQATGQQDNMAKQAGEIAGLKQQVSHLQDGLRAMDTATGLAVTQALGEGEQRSAIADAILTAVVYTVGRVVFRERVLDRVMAGRIRLVDLSTADGVRAYTTTTGEGGE